jgi:uroporphyrinogen-III synthase
LARDWDIVIFVSGNAVRFALELSVHRALPRARITAAVGRATARVLEASGDSPDLVPERFDSEGLLESPALQSVQNQRVLIVRGVGGRPLLGDTLRERGALVEYAEVYRRSLPAAETTGVLDRWPRDVQVVTTTSIDVLENLVRLLGDRGAPLLRDTPLVVVSERMEQEAARLGVRQVVRAAGADDRSMTEALCRLVPGRGV